VLDLVVFVAFVGVEWNEKLMDDRLDGFEDEKWNPAALIC